jgi:hypothetical protein
MTWRVPSRHSAAPSASPTRSGRRTCTTDQRKSLGRRIQLDFEQDPGEKVLGALERCRMPPCLRLRDDGRLVAILDDGDFDFGDLRPLARDRVPLDGEAGPDGCALRWLADDGAGAVVL